MTPRIPRPWDYHSGVHCCATCNGLGTVPAHRRATVDDPYPENNCPDCDGDYHEAECDVCGSMLEVTGYDCLICATVAEIPASALTEQDALAAALKAAMQARLAAQLTAEVAA